MKKPGKNEDQPEMHGSPKKAPKDRGDKALSPCMRELIVSFGVDDSDHASAADASSH